MDISGRVCYDLSVAGPGITVSLLHGAAAVAGAAAPHLNEALACISTREDTRVGETDQVKSDSAVVFAELTDAVSLFAALPEDAQQRILALAAELAAQGK